VRFDFLIYLSLLCLVGCGLAIAPTQQKDECVYVREMVKNGSLSREDAFYWWSDCAPFPASSTKSIGGN
jgi:hypothetical protein